MAECTKKPKRLPHWFKQTGGKLKAVRKLSDQLDGDVPHSICEEARCPNRSECFSKGVLTFMILGTVCTRNCGFCSVEFGRPMPPDAKEADQIINAIEKLNLRFVVLTSPNRDDLPDEGSGHYAYIIRRIREAHPSVKIEVLIPDFKGKDECLAIVMAAKPDVINHNVETVPSLYKTVRKGSLYNRSMNLLKTLRSASKSQNSKLLTKTGVMVGLGETKEELKLVFQDAYDSGIDILTIGQYLKPDKKSLDIEKYYHPDEFEELKEMAEDIGIRYVFSGPSVRSSYFAEHVFEELNPEAVFS